MEKEENGSVMEVLDLFLMKCKKEEVEGLKEILAKEEFPLNVNFHLIKKDPRPRFEHLTKNYYVTFKFIVIDKIVYVDYYNVYFNNTLKVLKHLELKQMKIYKPKLTQAKDYIYNWERDGVADESAVVEDFDEL